MKNSKGLALIPHPMKKGFTFIEILVTVTIIALLIAIGAMSYSSINKRSRDARRKSDLEQVRSALEMYRTDTGYYPLPPSTSYNDIAWLPTPLAGYLDVAPTDPSHAEFAPYQIKMTNELNGNYYGYCLAAVMESTGAQQDVCNGDFPPSDDGSEYNYSVKNP